MTALSPMLATDGKGFSFPSDSGWTQERKLDGWRFLFHVTESGVKSIAGRNGSDRSGSAGLTHIEAALEGLPHDTIVDCEVIMPGARSTRVPHELARPDGNLEAHAFDLLRVAGMDLTGEIWTQRRELLVRLADEFDAPVYLLDSFDADEARHDDWVADGHEGSVVKRKDATYRMGAKSKSWIKFKPQVSDEAVITGFEPGKGRIEGSAGAFKIRMLVNDVETTCSTATDAIRAEIKADPDKYLGKIIEVAHHGLQDSGKPRHPTFVRLREDLQPVEAPEKELPEVADAVASGEIPWSPVRSPNNPERFRNVKQMKPAKFDPLYAEMLAYADSDPEGFAIVEADRKRRDG